MIEKRSKKESKLKDNYSDRKDTQKTLNKR